MAKTRRKPTAGVSSKDSETPWFRNPVDLAFVVLALGFASMVELYFDGSAARAFDVPKAWALKSLVGGLFLIWIVWAGLFSKVRFASASVYAPPVILLTAAMALSTVFSIDPVTSWIGVYERQFGFQGFLGCVGLYLILSTHLPNKRAAVSALICMCVVASVMGAYSMLQSWGADPWLFFLQESKKVHSTLGNANFSGNALALVFPLSLVLAAAALALAFQPREQRPLRVTGTLAGLLLVPLLMLGPSYLFGAQLQQARSKNVQTQRAAVRAQRSAASGDAKARVKAQEAVTAYLRADRHFRQSAFRARVGFQAGAGLAALLVLLVLAASRFGFAGFLRNQSAWADGASAGALVAVSLLIAKGLECTLTRGAIVGAAVACLFGLSTFPFVLFWPRRGLFWRSIGLSGGLLTLGAAGVVVFALKSNSNFAETLRSIPEALNPNAKNLGKGQGTRWYLWSESPRVLTRHEDTLRRQMEDRRDLARVLTVASVKGLPFEPFEDASDIDPDTFSIEPLTQMQVLLFGIGIETYRYAFMSHKSRTLERRDPMTNHDNPHNNYLYLLASLGVVGVSAYLYLLGSLFYRSFRGARTPAQSIWERVAAFGILCSTVSYAVYSVAGFDSVGCSVFLFWLLAASAVLVKSNEHTKAKLLAEWAPRWAGKAGPAVVASWALILCLLLGFTVRTGFTNFYADQAMKAPITDNSSRIGRLKQRVEHLKRALAWSPHESFYKQQLGNVYARLASQTFGRPGSSGRGSAESQRYAQLSMVSFYAALEHAWAPENIFIGIFQLFYQANRAKDAIEALQRGLRHSPHLGAVRANLASLQIAEGQIEAALENCLWALDTDRKSALAGRVCGEVFLTKKDYRKANAYLTPSLRRTPNDERTRQLFLQLAVNTQNRALADEHCRWLRAKAKAPGSKALCAAVEHDWEELAGLEPMVPPEIEPSKTTGSTTSSNGSATASKTSTTEQSLRGRPGSVPQAETAPAQP